MEMVFYDVTISSGDVSTLYNGGAFFDPSSAPEIIFYYRLGEESTLSGFTYGDSISNGISISPTVSNIGAPGDNILDNADNAFTVKSVSRHQGLLSYQGCDAHGRSVCVDERALNAAMQLNRPGERLFSHQFDAGHLYALRHASWQHTHRLAQSPLYGLTGCRSIRSCYRWLDVWFREGQAVHMSGAGPAIRISTLSEFYQWWQDETHVNPISIHRWTDYPDLDRGEEYYPMFGLAYAYLVDPVHGHGAGIADMRALFALMKERQPFADAFQGALGLSLSSFEADFYELMAAYLSKAGKPGPGDLEGKMALWTGVERGEH